MFLIEKLVWYSSTYKGNKGMVKYSIALIVVSKLFFSFRPSEPSCNLLCRLQTYSHTQQFDSSMWWRQQAARPVSVAGELQTPIKTQNYQTLSVDAARWEKCSSLKVPRSANFTLAMFSNNDTCP